MERKNKASLFLKYALRHEKEDFRENLQAWACRFFLGIDLCLQDEKESFAV
jgi:hypothetical protein